MTVRFPRIDVPNLICKFVGHSYYQGTITLALNLMPEENGNWHAIKHTSTTILCRRCRRAPFIGAILVGSVDTNIKFNARYSIDNFGVFTGEELVGSWLSHK